MGLVLTVWGILGLKIVRTVNPPTGVPPTVDDIGEFRPVALKRPDGFGIVADYRDPFLGTLPRSEVPGKKAAVQKKEALPEKDIRYTGFITENTTGKKIFFLTVDGQQQMLDENEVLGGVRLVSGDAEKIKVRYHGKTKSVPITQ